MALQGLAAGLEGRKGRKKAQTLAARVTWVRNHCLHHNGDGGNGEKGMGMNTTAKEGAAGPGS